MRAGDIKRINLSASPYGRPVIVLSSVAVLHAMSVEDAADAVWVEVFNGNDFDVSCELIVCPSSPAEADMAAATMQVLIPANDQRLVIEGHEVRKQDGAPFQVGIRVPDVVGDSGLRAIGHAVRRKGAPETP